MQFINIAVHSVEDMNYRVHLQHEFTLLELDDYLSVSLHQTFLSQCFGRARPFLSVWAEHEFSLGQHRCLELILLAISCSAMRLLILFTFT